MDNLQQQLDGTLPPLAMEAAAVAVWVPAVVAACDLAADEWSRIVSPNDAPAEGISGGNTPAYNDSAAHDSSDDASGSSADVTNSKDEGDLDTALEGDEPSLSVVSSVGSSTSSSNEKQRLMLQP